jgi:hypothetical protein
MPFKSDAQRKYLFANEPEIAKKWAKEYPNQDYSKLPDRVKKGDDELHEQDESNNMDLIGIVLKNNIDKLLGNKELHSYFANVENFQQFIQDLSAFFENQETDYPTVDQLRKYLDDFKYGQKTIDLTLNELSKSKEDK